MANPRTAFETLFNRDLQSAGNRDYLLNITKEYPYFTAAQFYLLAEDLKNAAPDPQLATRAAVQFSNPHWLNFQLKNLHSEKPLVEIQPIAVPVISENLPEKLIVKEEEVPVKSSEEVLPPLLKFRDIKPGTDTSAMLFEPMHMVDYFASQGIKLNEDAIPTDKLGKQLKSFTEWLKTMKKLHTESNPAPSTGTLNDTAVQQQAEKSNTEDEVLTEAMAEVLIMQGKKAKAVQVYEKLSLLDPLKSAYFAAKIESLKGI